MRIATQDIEQLARRRAKAKLGFWSHATVYVAVNTVLVAISLATGRHWAVFPLLGWGLGLLLHGLSVWLFAPGNLMLERMVAREREQLAAHGTDPW
ncbi:2TM domain-containing protein [Variovorax dokdonensis]|uniref:2TM domain-containing protein n=1 Tax=Variovorax dokdonensis TaxID=344883 RepID=A0ABT7NEW1_9BURK|nr:2TM domain-containing protein [Variovorax dokdonensis]MDM0046487.1 2TM domain-containing protein [Variovorax dokdonensis]